MKYRQKSLICLLCVVTLGQPSGAVTIDVGDAPPTTDYSAIWLRNVFDLKPASDNSANVPAPQAAPPPDVKLTGLTELFHVKRALLLIKKKVDAGKTSGNPEMSYILAEGERRDTIEVISIDLPGKTAKIKLDGLISTINLETGSTSNGSTHAGYNQRPGVNPVASQATYNYGVPASAPSTSRMVRPVGATSNTGGIQLMNQGGYWNGSTASSAPGTSLPGSSSSSGNSTSSTTAQPVVPPPDVTAAMLAAQQAAAQVSNRTPPSLPANLSIPDPDSQSVPNQATQNLPTPPGPPNGVPAGLPAGAKVTGSFTLPPSAP